MVNSRAKNRMHLACDLVSTKGLGRVRERGQSACKALADGEKGQLEGGWVEIDDELYPIVGNAVDCIIGYADGA